MLVGILVIVVPIIAGFGLKSIIATKIINALGGLGIVAVVLAGLLILSQKKGSLSKEGVSFK